MTRKTKLGGGDLKWSEIVFVITSLVLVLIGALGVFQIHTKPIMPIQPFEVALGMPWRLLVALYVFFVVNGFCVIASLGEIFGVSKLEPIIKDLLLMAIITILVGLTTIGLEIEQTQRAVYALIGHVNPHSVMFWMIMFYVLELIFLVVEAWLYLYDDLIEQRKSDNVVKRLIAIILTIPKIENSKEFAKAIGFIAVVTSIIAISNLGALFSVNYLPFWHGPFLPIYFVLSAMISGTALAIIGVVVTDYARGNKRYEAVQTLRVVLGASLSIALLFTAWNYIIKAYPTSTLLSREATEVFVFGSYAFNFWFFEVTIGLIIPIILLAVPRFGRDIRCVFVASILTVVGVFFSRFDLITGGQLLKTISGLRVPAFEVHPFEIMATIGFLSLAVFLYYICYKLLPMEVEVSREESS